MPRYARQRRLNRRQPPHKKCKYWAIATGAVNAAAAAEQGYNRLAELAGMTSSQQIASQSTNLGYSQLGERAGEFAATNALGYAGLASSEKRAQWQLSAQQQNQQGQLGLGYAQLAAQQQNQQSQLGLGYSQLSAQQQNQAGQLGLGFAQLGSQTQGQPVHITGDWDDSGLLQAGRQQRNMRPLWAQVQGKSVKEDMGWSVGMFL